MPSLPSKTKPWRGLRRIVVSESIRQRMTCPVCGLVCIASHTHGRTVCGCIRGHRWGTREVALKAAQARTRGAEDSDER